MSSVGDESLVSWDGAEHPTANAWTVCALTGLLRMSVDSCPLVVVTLGPGCPSWFRKMLSVVKRTRTHFPLKTCEQSISYYKEYRDYMSKVRTVPADLPDPDCKITCHTYCMTVAVIFSCEFMRNSQKVSKLLRPRPINLAMFRQNLWKVFGAPPGNMQVAVSSTSNTDTKRLRAPHLSMVAYEIYQYLVEHKRSWKSIVTSEDFDFCLKLTTAPLLLRNHCYEVLHYVGLVPAFDLSLDTDLQSTNTRKFCVEHPLRPTDLPRDVRRVMHSWNISFSMSSTAPFENEHALLRAQCRPTNMLIWACQHVSLLHNIQRFTHTASWKHLRAVMKPTKQKKKYVFLSRFVRGRTMYNKSIKKKRRMRK